MALIGHRRVGMRRAWVVTVVAAVLVLSGAVALAFDQMGRDEKPTPAIAPAPSATVPKQISDGTSTKRPSPSASLPSRSPRAAISGGWTATVYYTAVLRFHSGPMRAVHGCPSMECENGKDFLGRYPSSFVQAVRDEGTGKISTGKYLNWSSDVGYWLDVAPRDSDGQPLRPQVSAAASGGLPQGSQFMIVNCGREEDGAAPSSEVCRWLSQARWEVTDEFTPGVARGRQLDLYIGEQDRPNFARSPRYATFVGAEIRVS